LIGIPIDAVGTLLHDVESGTLKSDCSSLAKHPVFVDPQHAPRGAIHVPALL
jgi:hypothetical protein